ncbi:MAG: aspartate/glutamate racemase family protein [Geminicoccaceae bacterium]
MTTATLEHLPFTTDAGIGEKARIGTIILAADHTIEHELRRLLALPGVDIFATRIACDTRVTPASLRDMGERIAPALELILPGSTLDVVAFGCTSATMVLGEDFVFAEIARVQPTARSTTPITAALAAFEALGAKRIAVLTPYTRDVNIVVQAFIEERGFTVPVFGSFNEPDDPTVGRIDSESIENAICRLLDRSDADAVFVSCTSMRIAARCAAIEARTGIPVTSSNHALAWHCLKLANANTRRPELGQLFTLE